MRWIETTLGPHIDLISGPAFKSQYFTNNSSDIPLVKGENIGQGMILWDKSKFWPRSDAEVYFKFRLQPNDVVLAMDRPWVPAGLKYAVISERDPEALLVQRVSRIRGINGLSCRFLRYVISSPEFSGYIKNIMGGTNVPHISANQIRAFRFTLPPMKNQDRIASILSAYDDLIENNRRRIALLEQAARLLYREWFVRLRFPGHEHVRIEDGVPEDWEMGTAANLGRIITGKTPSTRDPDNFGSEIPFVKTPDMHRSRIIIETEECLSEKGAATQPNKTLPAGTILVACIGAKLGVVSITSRPCQTNQQINAVIPRKDFMTHYSLFALIDIKPRLEALGGGVTMPNVNKAKFASIPILIPHPTQLNEFEEFAKFSFKQIQLLYKQNINLIKARDLLLPRLMNGEIPV